jgi:hypothetical protein
MYNTFVVTRYIYGLETLVLRLKHLETLEDYHRATLRRLQSLPERTAKAAIYLLVGTAPLEARLDSAIASLLLSMGKKPGSLIHRLALQQLEVKDGASHSWFAYARKRMDKYNIDIVRVIRGGYSRHALKQTILLLWTETLKTDARLKSTLKYLHLETCNLCKPHPIWTSTQYLRHGTRQSIVKAKLVLGVYTLQADRSRFNQNRIDPTCTLCNSAPEDRMHFVLVCCKLEDTRCPVLDDINMIIPGFRGCFSREAQLQVILDHRGSDLYLTDTESATLDSLTTTLVYRLHAVRQRYINTL